MLFSIYTPIDALSSLQQFSRAFLHPSFVKHTQRKLACTRSKRPSMSSANDFVISCWNVVMPASSVTFFSGKNLVSMSHAHSRTG